jgi:DNA-directed RNA polymerase specialized sigma subunit
MHDDFDKLAPWAVATARLWCIKNRIRADLIPDITQEALIACWLAMRRHDPKKSTIATFCEIRMKGAMMDCVRRQFPLGYRRRTKHPTIASIKQEQYDHGRDNPGIAAADLRDWLDHAKLKLHGRELVVWSLMANNLSIREIVASTGIGTDYVFKIKRAIRGSLKEKGGS